MNSNFTGPAVSSSLEGPARDVPGLEGLHRVMSDKGFCHVAKEFANASKALGRIG